MKYLKKVFVVLLCIATVIGFSSCDKTVESPKEEPKEKIPVITEEVKVEEVSDFEEKKSQDSQIGVIVDSWLKVISLGERDGKLCVFVRNISDKDIQYAFLSVMAGDNKVEFPITTLTAGTNAILSCSNGYVFDENAVYYGWEIEEKAVFTDELTCYPDVFEIDGVDGYVSIKNISRKDIEGRIYIYYKNVTDGIYDDGVTYRAYVDGLKKGEKVQIATQHYLKDSSRILFVDYAE